MKKIATTFSGGSYSLKMSQIRLEDQLKKYFDGVAAFDENHPSIIQLMHSYPDVFKYRRGYGYWAWKPFVIKQTLDAVNEGDFVFYMDSGNDIISDPEPLYDLCSNNNGFMLFENRSGNPNGEIWNNREWTKKDCFTLMDCDTPDFVNGPQIDGAYQLYQKNKDTVKFVNEYLQYCLDPRIVTDEPNTTGDNYSTFVDHRHDQSVASLLCLKYNIKTFPEPSEVGNINPQIRSKYGYDQIFLHHRGTIYGRR